jgi:inosose dehydratase
VSHTAAPLRWAYAMNAWKPGFMGFARREEHERAFKVVSAAGFRAVELAAGSGRWSPLGRPENIAENYGSALQFRRQLADWGIDHIASCFYDPGELSFEDLHHGLSPVDVADHALIVKTCRLHAQFLGEVGGECLVVRPTPSFWKIGALSPGMLQTIADCWNAAAHAIAGTGVRLAMHVDALSALRAVEDIHALLDLTDAGRVGLAIDTAESTIACLDPAQLYARFAPRVFHFHFKNALARDEQGEYRLVNAERAMLQAGGHRGIARWFGELEHPSGLVDFPGHVASLRTHGYTGWIVVESDKGPAPIATGVLLNGWTVQRVLDPQAPSPGAV